MQIVSSIKNITEGVLYPEIKHVFQITLGELANLVTSFHTDRKRLFVNDVGSGFVKNLYATYLSYLPPEQFAYDIPLFEDERGFFAEVLKNQKFGTVFIFYM